eukprot:3870236-Pyramimonas_sp.AAC.1
MTGIEYNRPLSVGGWNGTAGVTWQQTGLKDDQGRTNLVRAHTRGPAPACMSPHAHTRGPGSTCRGLGTWEYKIYG